MYALRLISALAAQAATIHTVCSPWGARVILEETGRPLGYWLGRIRSEGGPGRSPANITLHAHDDFSAAIASGSFRLDGTIIVPCSAGTLGNLTSGATANLIHRAGAVALKEGWPLILVPRETPFSLVTLRTLTSLKEAGATILPAIPNFYSKPQSVEQLVDTVIHRILDHVGMPSPRAYRWK